MPQNWQRIYEVFTAVQQLPVAARHVEALRLAGNDVELARQVLDLVGDYDRAAAENFLCVREAPRLGDSNRNSAAPALVGAEIGPYRVLELLGAGGMGEVFLAERTAPFRMTVAIKILRGGMLSDNTRRRFIREQQALADLYHPGIVRLLDAGETIDGRPYFVMDYIDGPTLADAVRGKPLSSDDAGCLMLEITEAISYVHRKGFLHRDLKPQNVLFDSHGRLRVADFGVAKIMQTDLTLTRTGDLLGTPSYMSPEQAEGRRQDIGPATDIYGLGAILYFLLTGKPPFLGSNPRDTIRQVLDTSLSAVRTSRPDLDPRMEELCLRCLDKEPSRRPASAREVADALRTILAPVPAGGAPFNIRSLLDDAPHSDSEPSANGALTVMPSAEVPPPETSAVEHAPAKPPLSFEEMEKTAIWEACIYCGASTPERRDLDFACFSPQVLTLQAAVLALAGALCVLAWNAVGQPFAPAIGSVVLLLMLRYSAGLTKCGVASVPCCQKHPPSWLDDLWVKLFLIFLLAAPLLAMFVFGAFQGFAYTWENAGAFVIAFVLGDSLLLGALAWRYFSTVHARDDASDKLRLTGGPRGDIDVIPTRLFGVSLVPADPSWRRWDALAFSIVIIVTVITCILLTGDSARNPFALVALSSFLAPPVFVLFPRTVKEWYGYPALIAPVVFMILALAFGGLAG